ncbi:uncharacterized protein ARMOST_15200 [Armillaria ostoyae]|uniref:Reverse transcriptase RNase H-like domain-containing protein n=1 Tax=Armillaria ostoyae TaxID=47428 RepID=A0A284RSP9_ARMOS|nr:uncharacterized protein ARMOST_15200 [Armillaria ostoyae]
MDPDKMDSVINWKTPTSKGLLSGFLRSVGYLADDLPRIRSPMGILHGLTGSMVPFHWSYTEQRAFDEIKEIIEHHRNHSRVPLDYSPDHKPVWMVTDASSASIAGYVAQGDEWQKAKVAAFYSVKLSLAQQNYAVHELEMLAGLETMLRHRDILQGVHFTWITDHKGLIHLMKQKDLTGRQVHWLEKMSTFNFEIVYIPGETNILSDALSYIYTNDAPGIVHAHSEYTDHDDNVSMDHLNSHGITIPLLAGLEAFAARTTCSRALPKRSNADTGHPETSSEFAKRMKGRVHVVGPRHAQEGGSTENLTSSLSTMSHNTPKQVNGPKT